MAVTAARPRFWMPQTLAIGLCMSIALNGLRPMVSYRAIELGASAAQVGLVAASFSVLSLAFGLPVGRWIDRWGAARFVTVGCLIFGLVPVWLLFIESVAVLALSQAVFGLGQILVAVGIQTLIANGGPASGRDGRFSAFMIVMSLGQVIGPGLAGIVAGQGDGGLAIVFAGGGVAMGIATAVAALLWRRTPVRATDAAHNRPREGMLRSTGRLLRVESMPQAILASTIMLASMDVLLAYLPVYGEENGIPVQTVGMLLAARAAASMISRLALVPLLRLVGRRRLIIASLAMPGILLVTIPLSTHVALLLAVMIASGSGFGLCQPLTMSWVAGKAPEDMRGTAMAMRISGNRLGQMVLPGSVGLMAASAGVAAVFVVTGLALAASSFMAFRTRFEDDYG